MPELNHEQPETRSLLRSFGRGFMGRCPNCGEGRMFSGFLTLQKCNVCGTDLDEMEPSLLLPLAVGLVIVAVVAHVYYALEIMGLGSTAMYVSVLVPITAIVSVLTIRPFKGALVGIIWALRSDNPPRG